MKSAFIAVMLLMTIACFAILPKSVTYVNLEQRQNLYNLSYPIESTSPCQVNFEVSVDYLPSLLPGQTQSTSTEIYLQLSAIGVPNSNFKYVYALKNINTGDYIFQGLKTTTARIGSGWFTSRKTRLVLNPSDTYMLEVQVPASTVTKNMFPPFTHWRPLFKLTIGAYQNNLQVDQPSFIDPIVIQPVNN